MVDTPERPAAETSYAPETGMMPESGASGVVQEVAPRPETYLEKLEKHGAQVRPDDFQQPVAGNQNIQITTPPSSNVPTVNIPANQVQIMEMAKGSEDKAVTWLARYWIRLIKRSVHFGWNLVMPPPPQPTQPTQQVQQPVQPTMQVQQQPVQPVQTVQIQSPPSQPTAQVPAQDPQQPTQQQVQPVSPLQQEPVQQT